MGRRARGGAAGRHRDVAAARAQLAHSDRAVTRNLQHRQAAVRRHVLVLLSDRLTDPLDLASLAAEGAEVAHAASGTTAAKSRAAASGGGVTKGETVTVTVLEVRDGGLEVQVGDGGATGFVKRTDLGRDRDEQRPERFQVGQKFDALVIGFDRSKKPNFSIKARQLHEEKEAVEQYGSSDSGASLGDILGEALKAKKYAQAAVTKQSPSGAIRRSRARCAGRARATPARRTRPRRRGSPGPPPSARR